jgi:Lon protease-like protein
MRVPRRYLNIGDLPALIPVFPLAGVLLLPKTRLPLNIFEPRYLAMVDGAMDTYRLIGMIQPKNPDEEGETRPDLASVGCAGRIVEYAETDDGRYLITLAGIARFRVSGERTAKMPYREVAADYAPFAADMENEGEVAIPRDRLLAALKPYLTEHAMKTDWKSIEEAPPSSLVNALAMICPFEPKEKQALLEARSVKDRSEALIALLEMANAAVPGGRGKQPLH